MNLTPNIGSVLDDRVGGSGFESVDLLQSLVLASRIRRHATGINMRATVGHVYYGGRSLPALSDADTCHDSVRIKIQVHAFLP